MLISLILTVDAVCCRELLMSHVLMLAKEHSKALLHLHRHQNTPKRVTGTRVDVEIIMISRFANV